MENDLRHDILIPSPQEMIEIPEFREVVLKNEPWEELTVDSFRPVFDCFPEIFNEWFIEKKRRLVGLLQEVDPSADETRLSSVTTIFQCKTCHRPVTYPHVMVHWCDGMWTSPNCTRGIEETGGPTPWKTPALEFNFRLYPDTEEVVNHLVELFNHHCQKSVYDLHFELGRYLREDTNSTARESSFRWLGIHPPSRGNRQRNEPHLSGVRLSDVYTGIPESCRT